MFVNAKTKAQISYPPTCCIFMFILQGELPPSEALKALTIFEGKFSRLKEERDNIAKALLN